MAGCRPSGAGTTTFADLRRDPRFALHTATVDTRVSDGDAEVWGTVEAVDDAGLHQRYAQDLFDRTGLDVGGGPFVDFFRTDVTGASSVEVVGAHLEITTWRGEAGERVVTKH